MLRLSNESGICLPKMLALLFACLLFISSLAIATPLVAYAEGENTLGVWGQYFNNTYEKVDAYHFALMFDPSHQVVSHLEGATIAYAIEDTSEWPDPDALNSTVLGIAKDMWGGRVELQQCPTSEAIVTFKYGGVSYGGSGTIYAVTTSRSNSNDGTLLTSGERTEIALYGPWFDLSGAWLAWAGFGDDTDTRRARVIGHELGHVLGLADVYSMSATDELPLVEDALMGNTWLGSYDGFPGVLIGASPLSEAGTPDINGLNILQHDPWYQEGSYTYYWHSPGVYSTGWRKMATKWHYFRETADVPPAGPAGSMLTGLVPLAGKLYLFSPSGASLSGLQSVDGHTYYFAWGGRLLVDGQPIGNLAYPSGGMASVGWQIIGSSTYYFRPVADSPTAGPQYSAVTGTVVRSGYTYSFSADGVLLSITSNTSNAPDLITTYGVRDGSAGPDYLGISNTNFDFPVD